MRDDASFVVMFVVMFFFFIGMMVSIGQRDDLKSEAVQRGFAEWIVNTRGNTTFKWKEAKP